MCSLFSIGNLSALYSAVWPECWSTHEVCDKNWIAAVTYLQIIGIIVGQILVGFEGDWIGRRFGLVQDALIMTRESSLMYASRVQELTSSRSGHAHCVLGNEPERMGHLLWVSPHTTDPT
jgi:hypothetical protein